MTPATLIDPFSISPNPNTLFITPNLKAVLYQARGTVNRRQGLVAILADAGMGKSTIVRFLYGEYDGDLHPDAPVPLPILNDEKHLRGLRHRAAAQPFGAAGQASRVFGRGVSGGQKRRHLHRRGAASF